MPRYAPLLLAFMLSACKSESPPEAPPAVAPNRAPIAQDTAWAAAGVVVQLPAGEGMDVYSAKLDVAACARRIDYVLTHDPALAQGVAALPAHQRACLVPGLIRWCLEQYPKWFPNVQDTPENAYFPLALESAAAQKRVACTKMKADDTLALLAQNIGLKMPRIIPAG